MCDSTTPTKRCSKCSAEKPLTPENFTKDNSKPDGYCSWCRECRRKAKSERSQALKIEIKAKRASNPDFALEYHAATGGYKICSRCEEAKLATREYFEIHDQKPDGLRPECRVCMNTYMRNHRNENLERFRKYARAVYHRNPETQRRYRESRREAQRQYNRIYAVKNSDRLVERARQWALNNPERNRLLSRVASRKRYSRLKNTEGSYSADDITCLYEEQSGLCAYCGIRLYGEYDIDHVVPLSRGGSNWPDNLLLACPSCNRRKNTKTLEEWMEVRGW